MYKNPLVRGESDGFVPFYPLYKMSLVSSATIIAERTEKIKHLIKTTPIQRAFQNEEHTVSGNFYTTTGSFFLKNLWLTTSEMVPLQSTVAIHEMGKITNNPRGVP